MGKWAKIGNVCKSKDSDSNYLKFADNITVMKNNEELELNKSRTSSIKMLTAEEKKKDFVLGEIHNGEEKIAEILKGKEGKKNYIKFDKNISFKVDTVPFKANTSNAAQIKDPVENVKQMIKNGLIKEEDSEKRLEKAKQVSSWLVYEVSLPDDSPMRS